MRNRDRFFVFAAMLMSGVIGSFVTQFAFSGRGEAAAKDGAQDRIAPVLKAQSFEVYDRKGKLKAKLWHNSGSGVLQLLDKNGKLRASLNAGGNTPMLHLAGEEKGAYAMLDGHSLTLQVKDIKGRKLTTALYALDIGGSGGMFVSQDGKTRVSLGLQDNGLSAMWLGTGREGSLTVTKEGDSKLELKDKTGKAVWTAPK